MNSLALAAVPAVARLAVDPVSAPDATWLDYISAIGAVATPILVLGLTAVGWKIRHQLERKFELEDKLREGRVQAYNEILEPFIMLLMSDSAWKADPKAKAKGKSKDELALQTMLSLAYRRHAFQMALVGGDAVMKSYNDLMQYVFSMDADPDAAPDARQSNAVELLALLGKFLLEIRRSMGNEATGLDHWQMLEWFITDARSLRGKERGA